VSKLSRALGAAAELAGRQIRTLPGVAALGCAAAGTWHLWGWGWALLVAAGFLLVLAREVTT
jgi:MYXO-CTERM domain-containing protein